MRVTLVDPAPERIWRNTFAAWREDLDTSVTEPEVAAVVDRMVAVGVGSVRHELSGQYVVLNNTALHARLRRNEITEVAGTVAGAERDRTHTVVRLRDGRDLRAGVVVDASGSARALSGGRPPGSSAQQTAVGVDVDAELARPVLAEAEGLFMDWRAAPDAGGREPTFLYAVPLGSGRMLLEETSLTHRPGLSLGLLRQRLHSRLSRVGIIPDSPEERVRFPLDDPIPDRARTSRSGVLPFGAAAGLVHPATGFSVATSLCLAPRLACALGAGLERQPVKAVEYGWSLLWPREALAVRKLQLRAAAGLLAMPASCVPEFFDVFFSIGRDHRRAFMSSSSDFRSFSGALTAVFERAPWRIRRLLITGGLGTAIRRV